MREQSQRTKGTAFAVLLEEYRSARTNLDEDDMAREMLSEPLLRDVFREAWRFQFDEDRSECRRRLRDIIDAAVKTFDGPGEGGEE